VVYDPESKLGVTIIGVNNPHMSEDEIPSTKLCPGENYNKNIDILAD
jgi:hypothetical protein